jgi:hypothetical protein
MLVLNPPGDRPIAWPTPAFLGAGTVLMGAHDGAVDHRVFIARVGGQMLENPFSGASFGPPAESAVNILPVTEALRRIPPGNASAIAVEHRLHEQVIIRRCYPDHARAARATGS